MKVIQTADLTPEGPASQSHALWIYNGLDCCLTHEIHDTLRQQMDSVAESTYQFSLALQAPILEMNMRGVKIDVAARDQLVTTLRGELEQIVNQFGKLCRSIFGTEVNFGSPKQLNSLFYEWLNLPHQKKRNGKGQYTVTTDRDALEKLSGAYLPAKPFVSHILKARDIAKQISTLEGCVNERGRAMTGFSIAGTKTGRLASSLADFSEGGNLQNIDRRIRRIFVADPGYKLANIDLEQADGRNVGAMCYHLFGATKFLDATESGDLHTTVCRMCWTELPWTSDPKQDRAIADTLAVGSRVDSYRQLAKKLGHGTNFNGQPTTMAKHTHVARKIIEDFQRRYFTQFPEVKQRIDWVDKTIRETGQLTTLFGRRRHFFKRRDDNKTLNEACAFDPQSMTADEINHAMLRIWALGRRYDIQLLLQVHDSFLIQYPEHQESEIIPLLKEAMKTKLLLRGVREFIVPSEIQVGWNWDYVQYDKSGNVVGNSIGLIKYRGEDSRTRHETSS